MLSFCIEIHRHTYHMSICVEYSEEPSSTSGGLYHRVTTSFEYVLVGTDLARARPANMHKFKEKWKQSKQTVFKSDPRYTCENTCNLKPCI